MKASYWQRGESLDYINPTEEKIEAGEVIALGDRIGIAGTDIRPGALGTVHVMGVYEFPKKDKAEMTVGMEVYITEGGITSEATSGEAGSGEGTSDTTKTVTNSIVAGFVAAPSPAESTKVYVKINA